MKQLLQNLRSGAVEVAQVPAPGAAPGHVLIQTTQSLVSVGTERMLAEFGKANLIGKARRQPDKVRQTMSKIKTDGLAATWDAVEGRLDQPMTPGYCNVGTVIALGEGVTGLAVGDRVASNGKHAEIVSVPRNLCAAVPDTVDDACAAFTVVGAIALQGIRLAAPTLGESVVVIGLGLIGLMTVQLLKAQGCRVLGVDFDPAKLALARRFGADVVNLSDKEDPVVTANAFARGRGVDAVLITATTTSSEPVRQAARMCRQRGRIVLVGVTGLELSRADFYEKELTFQVSCSYGPGRYDSNYEEKGHDYPAGFVRWTEQRNFEAVLDMLAVGGLDVAPLVSHRFEIDEATKAYEVLVEDGSALGILIAYPHRATALEARVSVAAPAVRQVEPKAVAGFIGAGNYGGRVLAKAFKQAGCGLDTIVSSTGVAAAHYGRKFSFAHAASDADAVITSETINTVVIATRHDSHARYVVAALEAGKNVFVEKPLCLTRQELADIEAVASRPVAPALMVGFNRRFAPMVVRLKRALERASDAKSFVMTVNAGAVDGDHWVHDPAEGGGRIIGEACHFIDLLRHLAGVPIESCKVTALRRSGGAALPDTAVISLGFGDGSIGVINYLANGHRSFAKERLEVFCGGRIAVLDNFRKLSGHGWPGLETRRALRQDKGQLDCAAAFVRCIENGAPAPIALGEILEVSRVAIEVAEAARQ
ncbi:MAG: zinc-binding dehydrogenase [Rhizobiales bacterium]|nr:zinc-binding dehydrogenase [Hyphomicrobiales bacterium]